MMLTSDRYSPQKLPGHKNYLVWDKQEKRHLTTPSGNRLLEAPSYGKALAQIRRIEQAAASVCQSDAVKA